MSTWLKQSTSVDIAIGPFVDDTDGKTAETGLTITQPDVRLKKNGGAWAQKNAAQTLSHEENGWYEISLDATDTNTLGILIVAVHETGALPVWREFLVVPANVYDSFFSTDLLQVDVTQWLNAAASAMTGDAYARLGAPVGASISADIASNKTVVDAIKVRTDLTPEGFKKNTARSNFTFIMTDSTTHVAKTGLTNASFTKKYRLDNGSASNLTGTITEVDATNFPGLYSIDLTAGELNGDMVEYRFAAAASDDLVITFKTSA